MGKPRGKWFPTRSPLRAQAEPLAPTWYGDTTRRGQRITGPMRYSPLSTRWQFHPRALPDSCKGRLRAGRAFDLLSTTNSSASKVCGMILAQYGVEQSRESSHRPAPWRPVPAAGLAAWMAGWLLLLSAAADICNRKPFCTSLLLALQAVLR
ncbi:hypothetical protein SCUP234_12482 [Seiridium cupressi]